MRVLPASSWRVTAAEHERAGWRWYRRLPGAAHDLLTLDAAALVAGRPGAVRFLHDLPLRLGPQSTDAVVASQWIVCANFDAFRSVTPPRAAGIAT